MEVSRTSLLMKRIGAYIIDYGAIVLLGLWLTQQERLLFAGLELVFVYLFLYPLWEWLLKGRTPGKLVFGLTVINGAGDPPTLVQALIRGFTRHIEAPLGIITIFIYAQSARCQRVGDMLSRTYVIPTKDLALLRATMQASTL
ncbi:RDD family protein [Pseudomonas oryziphila]|uniref:RDD family protein n=2 Tax=Pseudomonas TaxID=286 RepID=A0ABM7CSQ1_9PSED|nr:RDD family protein [Pseudomonas oryziphila]